MAGMSWIRLSSTVSAPLASTPRNAGLTNALSGLVISPGKKLSLPAACRKGQNSWGPASWGPFLRVWGLADLPEHSRCV